MILSNRQVVTVYTLDKSVETKYLKKQTLYLKLTKELLGDESSYSGGALSFITEGSFPKLGRRLPELELECLVEWKL